jgi:translation elongation factor P/translation initiation factor 5A
MATLAYNEILTKTVIVMNDEPFLVMDAHVFRKQQRKPVNQTKLKSLKTGRVIEQTFHQNETAQEADLEKRQIEFIYENRGAYWFCEPGNPGKRFELPATVLGDAAMFIKPKSRATPSRAAARKWSSRPERASRYRCSSMRGTWSASILSQASTTSASPKPSKIHSSTSLLSS